MKIADEVSSKMQVKVKFFAMLRERIGKTELWMEVSQNSTISDLWVALKSEYPALSGVDIKLLYAVNSDYVQADHVLQEGDEVVFAIVQPKP